MNKSRRVLLALGLGLLPFTAFAGDRLEWEAPTERENGQALEPDEIGGYEVRYTVEGADPEYVILPDPEATTYPLDDLPPGAYQFRIAVYDTNGLYSAFVDIEAVTSEPNPPGSPPGFIFKRETYPDPAEQCAQRPRCTVGVLSARYRTQ